MNSIIKFFFVGFALFLSYECNSIFVNSIPKCGTHLLNKVIELLTGKTEVICSGYAIINEQQLSSLGVNNYFRAHAIYIPTNAYFITKYNHPTIFIYRDPRDQIISMINWIYKNPKVRPLAAKKSVNELIFELIYDGSYVYSVSFNAPQMKQLKGIRELYGWYMPWASQPNVYVTTFEQLVGNAGGGNDEVQLEELRKIARHIGLKMPDYLLREKSRKLFGGTVTFKQGQIGTWKKYFTKEHRKAFKKVAGQLLIDLGYEDDFEW